jgi:hypothetical protein
LKGERWIKLFGCRDIEYLRKKLILFEPDKAYISVSCFLNPELTGKKWKNDKAGYKYLDNILLSSDFVMDFDNGVNSLVHLLRAYNYLKALGHDEFEVVITKRGFHMWDLAFFDKECKENLPHSPKYREFYLIEKKKALCTKLESQGVEFDSKVSTDTRRIVKLWGSCSIPDDNFICKAYNDPNALAKEYIQNHSYLPQTEQKLSEAQADMG